ncbi:MAG TPA: type VI secretion system tube protein Hcp [Nitrosopumilaceae archaeon]|nr:type VI secretion system tube protein Hcp [Nitrosopumilaceae archaeon]
MRFEILVIVILGFTIIASTSSQAFAAVDMFLKMDGVEGESTDKTHGKEIDVLSWSWGASQSGSMAAGGGGGAGKVSMQDLSITKHIDKSSPKLFEALATGKHLKEAKLVLRSAGGSQVEYLVITLSDVLVSSYSTGGSSGDDRPTESISLNFAQIKMSYVEQDTKGSAGAATEFGWDIKANKKI